MKKFTKVSLTVSGVCLVAGIGLCISGFALGYRPGNILGHRQERVALVDSGTYEFAYNQEYEDISSIKLSVGAADCRIQSYDGTSVRVEAGASKLVDCKKTGDELRISYGDDVSLRTLVDEEEGFIRVYVPEDTELALLKLEGGAANVVAENLSCKAVDMEVGAGAFSYQGSVSKTLTVECGVGSVEAQLEGEMQDFNYELDCGLGSVIIENGPSIVGIGEERLDNQADKKMELECGLGSILVSFL